MSFKTQRLVNQRVLVTGKDITGTDGTTTLNSTQWDEINANKQYSQATEDFDKAVDDFFAPLLNAADVAKVAMAPAPQDPASYVVLNEEVEGVQAQAATLVHLDSDSIVLRLIEQGETDRLVWVDGSLEVLEATAPVGAISDDA